MFIYTKKYSKRNHKHTYSCQIRSSLFVHQSAQGICHGCCDQCHLGDHKLGCLCLSNIITV